MKKSWLVIAVMLMTLALGTSGALASQIDYSDTHTFYLTVQAPDSTFLVPDTGTGNITTAFTDYSNYNPSQGTSASSGPDVISNVNNPQSVSTTQAAGTWLLNRNTTTDYSGSLGNGQYGGVITRVFTGLGPDPNGNLNGTIGQLNAADPAKQLVHLEYTATVDGNYTVHFHDLYNLAFNLNQGTGSSFPVSWIDASSTLGIHIVTPANFTDNGNALFAYTQGSNGSSTPIPSDSATLTALTWDYGPNASWAMTAGQVLTLDVTLNAGYDAESTTSPVPLPPTVLLLGSGLVGLGLLRRKWSLKK